MWSLIKAMARALVERIKAVGATAPIPSHIPTQKDLKVQRSVARGIYRQRSRVERDFCKFKHFSRIAARFDPLAGNVLAAGVLA